jgi:hypothetical protein
VLSVHNEDPHCAAASNSFTSLILGSFISPNIFNNENCQVDIVDPNENSLTYTGKNFADELV